MQNQRNTVSSAGAEIMSQQFDGNSVFPRGEKNEAYAKYFTGDSYLTMLSMEGVVIGNVAFEPGCRNFWHIHHQGGQILLVTGGRGWYQAWNQPARELKTGDVVHIPAGMKHWHGAARDSWFAHIAVEIPAAGASNEWLEPVSDTEYNLLPELCGARVLQVKNPMPEVNQFELIIDTVLYLHDLNPYIPTLALVLLCH